MYSDDPIADFLSEDARKENELEKRPKCCDCRKHIQSDECYDIDGDLYCPGCMKSVFKVWTTDYME